MTDTTYNGWKNWATWNVFLWLGNDENLYEIARTFVNYKDLAEHLRLSYGLTGTPDGARYDDSELDTYALDKWLMDEVISEITLYLETLSFWKLQSVGTDTASAGSNVIT